MGKWLFAFVMVSSISAVGCGGGAKPPEPDPNFKTTTDPSDLTIPDQLKQPGG